MIMRNNYYNGQQQVQYILNSKNSTSSSSTKYKINNKFPRHRTSNPAASSVRPAAVQSMKLIHFVIFTMSSFFIIFIWITVLSNLEDETIFALATGGHIIDLQADHNNNVSNNQPHLFKINGFEYFSKIPTKQVKSHDRVLRRVTNVWVLNNQKDGRASIEINKLQSYNNTISSLSEGDAQRQKHRRRIRKLGNGEEIEEELDVVVQLKYYISSDVDTSLSVAGINLRLNEQSIELLESVADPSMICTKLVYLGPVDTVIIEGYTKHNINFVVIDDLKIAVGVDHKSVFGEEANDMVCAGPNVL